MSIYINQSPLYKVYQTFLRDVLKEYPIVVYESVSTHLTWYYNKKTGVVDITLYDRTNEKAYELKYNGNGYVLTRLVSGKQPQITFRELNNIMLTIKHLYSTGKLANYKSKLIC